MRTRSLFLLAAILILVLPGIVSARTASSDDLWDISQGSIVDDTSGALNYGSYFQSDIRNMFGGVYGTTEPSATIFKDCTLPEWEGDVVPAGYVHYVEWHTPEEITLRSFYLNAANEGMDRRAFSQFTLYSSSTLGGPWSVLYDTGPGFSYLGTLELESNVTPLLAQYFRAEFVQAPWSASNAIGPRIREFDGYDTLVPEPSVLALCGLLGLAGIGLAVWRR